jgi:hypothetical protein
MVVAEEFEGGEFEGGEFEGGELEGGEFVGVVEAVTKWLLFRDPNTPPITAAKIITNAITTPPKINHLLREARGAGT